MLDRRQLASQLVRAQAMLWSSDDPAIKARIQRVIHEVERRLLALDGQAVAPAAPRGSMARLTK